MPVVEFFRTALAVLTVAALAVPAVMADDGDYGDAVRLKLGSGFSNVVLGMGELPKNIINTSNEVSPLFGITGGALKGLLHALGRTAAGMVDVLTFPAPTQPSTTPPFVWQNWGADTTYGPFFAVRKESPKPRAMMAPPEKSP